MSNTEYRCFRESNEKQARKLIIQFSTHMWPFSGLPSLSYAGKWKFSGAQIPNQMIIIITENLGNNNILAIATTSQYQWLGYKNLAFSGAPDDSHSFRVNCTWLGISEWPCFRGMFGCHTFILSLRDEALFSPFLRFSV